MSPSRTFILRPIATSLLMMAITLTGIVAYKQLPISALPEVDYPTIQIITFYPGANPDVMASSVTAPLERQFGQVPGLQQMTSTSSDGSSVIALQFSLSLNIDVAEQEVQQSINAAGTYLPADLPNPPIYSKSNPADTPILTLALTSAALPLSQVEDLADTRLAPKISQLPGVGLVSISGGQKPAVRIRANPTALASYGLNLEDVRTALVAANVNQAKGNFDGPHQAYQIGANDQLLSSADYKPMIVAYRNGAPVKLTDVAAVTDDTENVRQAAWLNEVLVVLVMFLFLRNVAATIIPSIAVPVSLIGTLGVMYLLGYSLNNLTLMALTIATGFVVDDAIVMIENIARYIEEGEAPMKAALRGSEQIGFTIISLTISLIAVLIPLLFMGDIVGRLFREFAVTLSVTILVSAVVSLTLTPMMASKLLKHTPEAGHGRLYRVSEHAFNSIIAFYGKTLRFVLRFQTITLLVAAATLAVTIILFWRIPKGFFPIQDTGVIQGVSEAAQTVSFPEMSREQQALAKIIVKDPAVDSLSSFIGIDGTNTTLNSGRIQINLKSLDERKISATDVIRRLQPELASVAGITLFMQPVQDLSVDDRVSRTQFQYTLEDASADELNEFAPKMLDKLKDLPELRDVASDQQVGGLRATLIYDRGTAYRLGITPSAIDQTLYDAYGQRQVSTIFTQLNQYHVVLEVGPAFGRNPMDLRDLYIRTGMGSSTGGAGVVSGGSSATQPFGPQSGAGAAVASASTSASANSPTIASSTVFGSGISSSTAFPNGGQVPLSAFTHVETSSAPITVNHQGQFPVVTLSFNLAPDASLGDAVDAVNKVKTEIGMPPSVQSAFQGTAEAFQASLANEPVLILAALVTVYIVRE